MKKLLSILAAVGLTATASAAAVSCATTISSSNIKMDKLGNVTIKDQKIELEKDLDADVKSGDVLRTVDDSVKDGKATDDMNGAYSVFSHDKKLMVSNLKITFAADYAKKNLKSGDKVAVNISFTVVKPGAYDKATDYFLGTVKVDKKNIKFDTESSELELPDIPTQTDNTLRYLGDGFIDDLGRSLKIQLDNDYLLAVPVGKKDIHIKINGTELDSSKYTVDAEKGTNTIVANIISKADEVKKGDKLEVTVDNFANSDKPISVNTEPIDASKQAKETN